VTHSPQRDIFTRMATPNVATAAQASNAQAELEEELRQAERDFANGDFIELTIEELDRCIAAGKWPWPDESSK
jgi:hypothetical protein